ncbi:MAG: succinylglutamate desuccinylase/aspartoacylase family protein [Pseudomonadota bacterium]
MAKRVAFELGGREIEPGTQATVNLPVSVMPDHTPVHLSVEVIHGKRKGPVVFVSAAIHGDEVMGVEIARRLLGSVSPDKLRGTLMVVPIVNTLGFLNRSRYSPDRRDLNRSFPGTKGGSLASRLAHRFMHEIVARSDVGIDLHSAAVHRTNLPQMRVSPDTARPLQLSKAFGAPVVLISPLREGSLRAEAREMGVDVLLYEAGEGLRFDEMAARTGVAGILRVLHALEMVSARGIPKLKADPLVCKESAWVRAPAGGLLRVQKGEGSLVEEGERLGTISDPFGETEWVVTSPSNGIIVGRAVLPVVNEGDALFHIAEITALEDAEDRVDQLQTQLAQSPLFDEDEII